MSNNSLASLVNASTATNTPAPAQNKKGAKPVGNINIKIAGVTIFNRPVWKESTSETQFLNELNALAQADPAQAAVIIKSLLGKMEVEVNTRQSSDLSLAELTA